MRKFLIFIVAGAIVAAAVGVPVLFGMLKPSPERVAEAERPLSVFVEEARLETLRLTVSTQGEVRPRTEIDIVPQVQGLVDYVSPNFVEGGMFDKGDVLIRIEDADYRNAVIRAEATVAQAAQLYAQEEAEGELARRDWEELGEGEASQLTLRVPQLAEARARLNAARADLADARLQLSRTTIKAPFQGRLRTKQADIGQYVSPGQALGRIFSTDIVEIRLPLTDAELAMLNIPLAYVADETHPAPDVTLTGVVAGAQRTWHGALTRTDSAIDAQTRVLFGIAEVIDPYGEGSDDGAPLAVGLFVNAEIDGEHVENAIVLPRSALRGRDEVYVVNEDGELEIRLVTLASSSVDEVIIRSGVEAGEKVVTSAIRAPRNGLKVEPITAGANDAPAIADAGGEL